ncbi:MAG: pantoate--beta-alanine ligase, partial [Bdellovibrionota bacterium]
MTKVIQTIEEWKTLRNSPALNSKSLGFVPTMGALHAGHTKLVEQSRSENDLTLVSIFINPTQFNEPRDYKEYPRVFDQDLEALTHDDVDFVFAPSFEELYPDCYRFQVSETFLSRDLCGSHRPGHFTGMLTVVLKLLLLAKANRAYFGEKDYQQYLLVLGLADAFFLESTIVPVSPVRDAD